MENIFKHTGISLNRRNSESAGMVLGNQVSSRGATDVNGIALTKARMNTEYTIKTVETNNNEVQDFLFTLGCYEGETITVISILAEQYVVVVKDARYSIDKDLAECIRI